MPTGLAMSSELTYFSINIQRLRTARGLSQQALATALDVARTTISNWEKGVAYPLFGDLIRLANLFGVTLNDLVSLPDVGHTSSQPLARRTAPQSSQPLTAPQIADPPSWYGGEGNIIVLDTKAAAGLFKHHGHQEHWSGQPRIKLFGQRYTGNGLFAIQVEGDSMEPVLHAGDWLVIRELHDREQVRDGRIHVIVTKGGVVTKRVRRSLGGETLLCESDNPEHKPYHIGADDHPVIYDVLGLFREHVDDQPHGYFQRLLRLERTVADLVGKKS